MRDLHDVAKYIFINEEGEFRSGWRVLAFFLCFIVCAALLFSLTRAFATLFPSLSFLVIEPSSEYISRDVLIYLVVSNARNFAAAALSSAICARILERRSFGSVGFRLHRGWPRDFLLGSLMGASSLAIVVGSGVGLGAFRFDVQTRNWKSLLAGLLVTSSFFIIAGATEELLFRGFPFQALVHNLGDARAITITAILFGLAHISNPSASIFSTINTVLAGAWLGLAYLRTRNLWLATGLHWSWNFAMVFVFGLPVSGFTTLGQMAWLRGTPGAPMWVSGGSYGPEAGLAATAGLILSTLAIYKGGLFSASEEMLVATRHGKQEPAFIRVTPADDESSASATGSQGSERE
ncbi:MAG TPA: type II CAAX endopeptidase family protein [Blastocatellia bacterium]|nr:type II CAAX endopeptidase family protein [Blastocatellia bacterium]